MSLELDEKLKIAMKDLIYLSQLNIVSAELMEKIGGWYLPKESPSYLRRGSKRTKIRKRIISQSGKVCFAVCCFLPYRFFDNAHPWEPLVRDVSTWWTSYGQHIKELEEYVNKVLPNQVCLELPQMVTTYAIY